MSKWAGALLYDDGSGTGWTQIADTLQCVHCGAHWIVQPGSGIQRGWCLNCRGPECGAQDCYTCVPFERWLEQMEAKAKVEANVALVRGWI